MKRQARKTQRLYDWLGLQLVSDQGVTPPYGTPKEVANCFRISVHMLKKMRDAQYGPPYYQAGDEVRYPVAELKAWIKEELSGC